MMTRLQEAYADKEMPSDVKSFVEKVQAKQRVTIIHGLHSATSDLDKASQRLSDAIQAKQKHRAQWLQHLEESIKLWQSQLLSYKKRQQELQDIAKQAQKDVYSARRAINERNALAGNSGKAKPMVPPEIPKDEEILDLTGEDDEEEELLKKKMQRLLERSAAVVGVGGTSTSAALDIEMDTSSDELQPTKTKRPRSVEPIPIP